ncbi:MAG: hypothetical protein FJ403_05270 [Verrucomicrobia bacterium]|nr:hypothetical protein [Verrucomicrobiota bacterium]
MNIPVRIPISILLALSILTANNVSGATAELRNLSINGGVEDGRARLIIEAVLSGLSGEKDKLIYATALQHSIKVSREKIAHSIAATFDILQGEPKELPLTISGEGEIRQVTGELLQDWSIRQETNGVRTLILRPRKSDKPITQLSVTISAERDLRTWTNPLTALTLTPSSPALFNGYVTIEVTPDLDVQPDSPTGLAPIDPKFLPSSLRIEAKPDSPDPLAFRFHGSPYHIPLRITIADPEARRVVLRDFKLSGQLSDQTVSFVLTANARIKNPRGGSIALLQGNIALTDLKTHPHWRLRFEQGRFIIAFDRSGEFPIQLKFKAAVSQTNGWNSVDFRVAPSALQPIALEGLIADTQFEFPGAARPERAGSQFVGYLPADGAVKLSWKEARREAEGKLFYAAEMLSQIGVSPGLMRQMALLDFKVMQGELNRVALLLRGAGEVTRVQGAHVLAWNVEPIANSAGRRLVIQFNQPQKDQFALQVQMQTSIGALPQAVDAMQLRPEGATRLAGYVRILNEGAVRLEVVQAAGLSQISPEQFPETDVTRTLFATGGSQRFAYRFSGGEFSLRIQADQILPELSVSEVLAYHHAENELAIDAEFELDIREAPMRELLMRVPKGYAIARLNASGLSDYFLREPEGDPDAELRLVYGQPVSGRQIVQLRVERHQALGQTNWVLPRIEISRAKSVRGHLGVSADAGFRITPDRTQALTEIATAFFPRKVAGIQLAFRLSEPAWQATLRVERLPQTVQADAFHLFSIGEGIAYGSSVMHYLVSGAPISTLRIELSNEYFNVEFIGKDIRNWQRATNGYVVQLHSPVSGAYTLLATYERPFRAQGETLAFTGARPLDAQSEQGHTLVISAYQFQVNPVDVSPGLLPLETGEVPPEYRLFFDAPVLAAYRYTSRPFNLRLALNPLVQGDSLSQVVDRASLLTRISKEGQVLTDAHYFVKNRGNSHFRVTLPAGTQLWSATVNGAPVVPVLDGQANMIPLPQRADPNAVLAVDVKLASRSTTPKRVAIATPIVAAPVMLAEWKLAPDAGQRLIYRRGSLTPVDGVADISGFAQLNKAFSGLDAAQALVSLIAALLLVGIALVVWRWTVREGVYRYSARHLFGTVLGLIAVAMAIAALISLGDLAAQQNVAVSREVTFLAPVQQAGTGLNVEVANIKAEATVFSFLGYAWPALLALVVWVYGWITNRMWFTAVGWLFGWTLVAWAGLRAPGGAPSFIVIILLFLLLHTLIPALRRLWQLPRKPKSAALTPPDSGPAPAVASLLIGTLLSLWSESAPPVIAHSSAPRNAEFHSAVSPTFSRQNARSRGNVSALGLAADYKSAIQQSGTLRYDGTLLVAQAQTANPQANPVPAALYTPTPFPRAPALAESVAQEIRVEERFALGTAKIHWTAEKNQTLPLLFEPAVLTSVVYPTNALRLIQAPANGRRAHQLLALETGAFDVELRYQIHVTAKLSESGFVLPTQHGLINPLRLTLANLDVDVFSAQAASIERTTSNSNTMANLVLAPVNDAWINWRPRSRDVKRERAVFYAEISQLYVPTAGVIEGAHHAVIRPAQGELTELVFNVPTGATITDVSAIDPTPGTDAATNQPLPPKSIASLWRFDPDTRRLRVNLNPAQSRPFTLLIRSQVPTGPLPFEQSIGLLSIEQAAGQIGLLGIATGREVQLDSVNAGNLSPINLEDYPVSAPQMLQAQIPELTVRRAFRYTETGATVSVRASPVEPDVRVETQDTVSLGEDRTVLASNLSVDITRAGIFRLSFVLPGALDVESISGQALSHWTELRADAGRIITLHLRGKTAGPQQFAISLSGAGVKTTNNWAVPQLVLREASKQRGTLLIVPDQGMRLQPGTRNGVTQLDPQKTGIQQKGVLAFRILQVPWNLALDIEQVDPWIQVTSLQHATVSEALVNVGANLQYQIENTGLKAFRVFLPTNAGSVRFQGDQVSGFLPIAGGVTNNLQAWEIKLHRRVIGRYLLQVTYQTAVADTATETVLRGVQTADVNLQRGFVTVQARGRQQVRIDALPASLQTTEWQSIPRALQQDLSAVSANFAFRLVEPSFQLPLKLDRHEAAKLLPARVNNVTLTSVISDDGVMLTQARLEMLPGDKRLLYLTLPADARFWFAFVNQSGVWPWREGDRILVPLEPQARSGKAIPVEIFYSSKIGSSRRRSLDLDLLAPKFDLPLEDITWRVYLSEKWRVKDWAGTLQLQQDQMAPRSAAVDLQTYLQNEAALQRGKTKEAEELLAMGNTLLERGDPQQARRAFQAAYGLSQHDNAFNEDARVQLHNLKLQQALVGLNVRQAAVAGDTTALGARVRDLRSREGVTYTQQDAKEIIDRNTADENAAFMRLAERLIQQQDAAVSSPVAMRASIPEQGRLLTFKRAVLVDPWADLRIELEAVAARTASWRLRLSILIGVFVVLAAFGAASRAFRKAS